jgi:hypothetical protein
MKVNGFSVVACPTGVSLRPLKKNGITKDPEITVVIDGGYVEIGLHVDGSDEPMCVFRSAIRERL